MKVEWAYNLSSVLNSDVFSKTNETPIILLSRDSPNSNGKQFTTVEYNYKNIKALLSCNFHGYELLYQELPRKFYVDVDMKPSSPLFDKYTTEQMIQCVIEILDTIFTQVFPNKFHLLKNPNIFVSDLDSQNVKKSAHILFPNFVLKNLDETIHIKLILKTYLNNMKIKLPHPEIVDEKIIDLNVYGNNQNFRLPFQSKKGKTNTLIPVKRTSFKNCFAGVYEPISKNDLSMSDVRLIQIGKNLGQDLYDRKFPKNAGLSNKKNETTIIDFSSEVHSDLLDYEPKSSPKVLIPHNHDLVTFLVSCVHNHDRGQSWKVWWSVGQALKNIGAEKNDPDKYLDLWILWSSQCSAHYPNYIHDCKKQWKMNQIRQNQERRLRIGFLSCLAHWYYPKEVDAFLRKQNIHALFTLNDDDKRTFDKVDVYNTRYCKPFEMDDYDIIVSQAPMGSGKTFQMKELLKQKNKYKKVLVLSPRQTFSKEKHAEFKDICPDFHHYQDPCLNDYSDWTEIDKLVVQVESLVRFPDYVYPEDFDLMGYDLVILDEIESILFQFSSSTHTNVSKAFHVFFQIITKSKKIILADAFLTKRSVRFCELMKKYKKELKCKLDINSFNPNSDITAKIIGIAHTAKELSQYKEKFIQHLKNQLRDNKKICACITSKSFKNEIIDAILHDDVLLSNQILDYDGDSDDDKINKLQYVKTIWENPLIKLVIYTTKITVGINFDIPDVFHSIYIYGSIKCPNIRDILQAHFRVRHVIDKMVFIMLNCFEIDSWLTNNHLSTQRAYSYVENIYTNYTFSEQQTISELYNQITSLNILENNIGIKCYQELFIHLLSVIGYKLDIECDPIVDETQSTKECVRSNEKVKKGEEEEEEEKEFAFFSFPSRYIQNYNKYKLYNINLIEKRKKQCLASEVDKIILDSVFFYKEFIRNKVDEELFPTIIESLQLNSQLKLLKQKASTLGVSLWVMWETDLFNLYKSNCEIRRFMKNIILERNTYQEQIVKHKLALQNFKVQEDEKKLRHITNICQILKLTDSRDCNKKFGCNELSIFKKYFHSEMLDLFKFRIRNKKQCLSKHISILNQIFHNWNGLKINKIHKKKDSPEDYTCTLSLKSNPKDDLVYYIFLQILKRN